MNNQKTIVLIISFVLNVLFQVLLARDMALFEVAFCLSYVGFILMLPYKISRVYLLLIGFFLGFFVDIFYNTMGIHTLASLIIAYIRPFVIGIMTSRSNINTDMIKDITVREMGLPWYISYGLIMVLIHHAIVFFVEASSMNLIMYSIKHTFFSTIFSLGTILVIQYIFIKPQRN